MKKRIFSLFLLGWVLLFSLNVFASDMFYLYIEYYIVDSDGTITRLKEQITPEIVDNRFPSCTVTYPDGREEIFDIPTFNTSIAIGSDYMQPGAYTLTQCYIPNGYVRIYEDKDSTVTVPAGTVMGTYVLKVYLQAQGNEPGKTESPSQGEPVPAGGSSDIQEAVGITLVLKGEKANLTLPILNVNGRTMYPFRECLEMMGAQIIWHEDTRTASGILDKIAVNFQVGESYFYIDRPGEEVEFIDMEPGLTTFIHNSRTYIPIRYAAEALGFTVEWDAAARTIYIQ